jgi:predicted site-specific integrase-resolvase
MDKKWLTSRQILKMFNMTAQTLYNWRKNNIIEYKCLGGRRYLYNIDSITNKIQENKFNVIYCRVSNTKQKDDLIRQEEILKEWCAYNGYKIDIVYKDIASGMNENRLELNKLIEQVIEGKINKIFVTYKDRLTRFGFEYFNKFFTYFGCEIVVINATTETTFEDELIQDLISIIHHFSMKLYSNRRYQLKKIKNELEKIN